MASRAPPVPPDQQSGKARGAPSPADRRPEVARDPARDASRVNLKSQDRYGAVAQNTRNQGYQQDR